MERKIKRKQTKYVLLFASIFIGFFLMQKLGTKVSSIAMPVAECPVLDENNCEKAYEMVKDCVVEIQMGNAYGSGILWGVTEEYLIIATNKHVLEYWNDDRDFVIFPQGYCVKAKLRGVSASHDVGFLQIESEALTYTQKNTLHYAAKSKEAFDTLQAEDEIFYVGAKREETEGFFLGSVGEKQCFLPDFDEEMLYGYGYARTGMSGGGTFDAKGNLVGMISGATTEGETASIPLNALLEAYEECFQSAHQN